MWPYCTADPAFAGASAGPPTLPAGSAETASAEDREAEEFAGGANASWSCADVVTKVGVETTELGLGWAVAGAFCSCTRVPAAVADVCPAIPAMSLVLARRA